MGWFTNGTNDAAAAGKADAQADVKAGGFAKAGQPSRFCRNDDETAAYEEAYKNNCPRSWWA